ncbi:helix-turn-helix domain-containing protein [Dactylosporangium roseum]|uniref:Helix-turn-helix domain-containing protein n=1 Tax=Dactylosporangium roseum TaxID=47989 RepID=A0ABY5Z6S4_9ACTN|nr:helix-turn-helix domain-containing protein [Dactylosporangium roseum]UWZ37749.1 helix-turn-helix domain-containing protein [Dactylosporangium roseum]
MTEDQIDRFYADAGQRINRARRSAGLTQAQLAAAAGLTRSSVANVEAGRQRIPLHVLAGAAAAMRVDPGELFSPALLADEPGGTVVTLPLLPADPPSTHQFVGGALASVGMTVRWVAESSPPAIVPQRR